MLYSQIGKFVLEDSCGRDPLTKLVHTHTHTRTELDRLMPPHPTSPMSSLQDRFRALNPTSCSPALRPTVVNLHSPAPVAHAETDPSILELLAQLNEQTGDGDTQATPEDEEACIQALLDEAQAALEEASLAVDNSSAPGAVVGINAGQNDEEGSENPVASDEEQRADGISEQSIENESNVALSRILDEAALERAEEVLVGSAVRHPSPPPSYASIVKEEPAGIWGTRCLNFPSVPTTLLPIASASSTVRSKRSRKTEDWCTICTDNATIRCLGCEYEAGGTVDGGEMVLYCVMCWEEGHTGKEVGREARGHRWEKCKP